MKKCLFDGFGIILNSLDIYRDNSIIDLTAIHFCAFKIGKTFTYAPINCQSYESKGDLTLLYFWLGGNGLNFVMHNNLLHSLVATVVLTKL